MHGNTRRTVRVKPLWRQKLGDAAQELAAAAKGWHKGSTWKTTADFWFGTDSANYYDRIISEFARDSYPSKPSY